MNISDPIKVHPVILCGGSGTRLWPLSRKSYPKQFSKLMAEESLFQRTVRRFNSINFAPPLIVTGNDFRFIVTEQLSAIGRSTSEILIEPEGKNTAPAVLSAALHLAASDPDALLLVAPSDHIFSDTQIFRRAVIAALPQATAGKLITFGIQPTRPETGYGYLELFEASHANASEPQKLKCFVEKPEARQAKEMVQSGKHLWNAGLFLFTARAIIEEYKKHASNMIENAESALSRAKKDLNFLRLAAEPWSLMDDISIDYAIMEKTQNLAVMPLVAGWSDLGGWEAVWQESGQDNEGNVVSKATAIDCTNSLLRSESDTLELVGIGLDDIVAVAMPDAVVVAKKSQSEKVKEAVAKLRTKEKKQATEFPRDHRPWGWFESLVIADRFQVKRIVVHPGAALSLQSHHHRAEHWIVVAGTAKVTINEQVKLIAENQSVYIPLGAIHRMENPGKVPMELIEVQTGSYLGEDDIIRYDDIYSRE